MAETVVQASPVTVITGATQGIGLALARAFAGAGHDLLIVARSAADLERVADELARSFRVTVHAIAADLSTPEGCRAVADALEANGLHAEHLVNNAAAGLAGPFAEIGRAPMLALLDLNVRALTDLSRRLLPGMVARGRGGILNVASLGGLAPGPYTSAYYASKAYVISLSEALAEETRGTGVRVAVLAPGPVATGFHERQGTHRAHYIKFLGVMRPEEVARAGYRGFMRGRTLIVPGWSNVINALVLRLAPHLVMVPFLGWLLRPRGR